MERLPGPPCAGGCGGGRVGFWVLIGEVTAERWLSMEGRAEEFGVRRREGSRGDAIVDMADEMVGDSKVVEEVEEMEVGG